MQMIEIKKETGIFKMLSSPTRLKIVRLLIGSNCDVCVKDIAEEIGMSHSATSHQLAKLEDRGVVECCRNGQNMCYKLSNTSEAKSIKKILKDFRRI